jgi:general secretion pathway protein G
MKTRKGGFTLVELLIVIMIIAILAGMMLLATGSATDGAEATKVVNDLRNLKSAALLFYGDEYRWPANGEEASLDNYSDRPVVGASPSKYATITIGTIYTDINNQSRQNIGVELIPDKNGTPGVLKKLSTKAAESGLLDSEDDATAAFTGGATTVWMNMR